MKESAKPNPPFDPEGDVKAVLLVLECAAIITCLFLGVMFLGWAMNMAEHRVMDAMPHAPYEFGCTHTYINDRGEDTGECE
jgi:hypothetical protein